VLLGNEVSTTRKDRDYTTTSRFSNSLGYTPSGVLRITPSIPYVYLNMQVHGASLTIDLLPIQLKNLVCRHVQGVKTPDASLARPAR
jgi:hypothetical protein